MKKTLSFVNHSRNYLNNLYVYPVLSRRSQGISIGINLNVNNSCNWRCLYCQVDGLIRGKPDNINLNILKQELEDLLISTLSGKLNQDIPINLQRLNDIAISGNGEPTLSKDLSAVIDIISELYHKYQLNTIKTILITNGSHITKDYHFEGLKKMSHINGNIWYKIDSHPKFSDQINQTSTNLNNIIKQVQYSARFCKVFVQSCFFAVDDILPNDNFIDEYFNCLQNIKPLIEGVLLYTIARKPMLEEGERIKAVSDDFLKKISLRLEKELNIASSYYI